jgi:hypothetical protein
MQLIRSAMLDLCFSRLCIIKQRASDHSAWLQAYMALGNVVEERITRLQVTIGPVSGRDSIARVSVLLRRHPHFSRIHDVILAQD